jgi:putative transposase
VVVAFVDDHRDRFGVEPICHVLSGHGITIAPNSYYAHKKRAPSARSVRDERVLADIVRVQTDPMIGRGVYGVRKVHATLAREGGVDGRSVSRRQVERLMRTAGLQGARRGRRFVTTRPDSSAVRPPDLVRRDFTATEPNRLWVVDFTYVPTWSGMAFTAFVTDVFSRRIVGWRTAGSMPTALPLDALEMALWTRQREGHTDDTGRLHGLIHHSDAGSQGGFNWSSQHLDGGGVRWDVARGRCCRGPRVRGGSGLRIEHCGRRCVHRVDLSRLVRCNVSSGD